MRTGKREGILELTDEQRKEIELAPRVAALPHGGAWDDMREKLVLVADAYERKWLMAVRKPVRTMEEMIQKEVDRARFEEGIHVIEQLLGMPEHARKIVERAEKMLTEHHQEDGDDG